MQKYIRIFISLALLGYGLIRIGVGSLLLGQEIGLLDFQAFHNPVKDIGGFLTKSADKQSTLVTLLLWV